MTKTKTKTLLAIVIVGFAVISLTVGVYFTALKIGLTTSKAGMKNNKNILVLSPNGGENFFSNGKIPFNVKINSKKVGSIKIWMKEEVLGGYYPVKTANNIDPTTLNLNQYVTEFVKSETLPPPIAGTHYRAFAEWISNDGSERLNDQGDGQFSIENPSL